MKQLLSSLSAFLLAGILLIGNTYAQENEWVNQVIVVNSGKNESTPPFTDYVTVQTYDPASQSVTIFGTIYTQAAQDIEINGNKAWVAATDSIILYNIDTYQRIAAVADSGISRIYYFDGKLAVTKKWPVSRFYVEILNASNLALLGLVQNISGDCGEALFEHDSLYVAVNGGTTGTEGKLAVISKTNWILCREINFGVNAVGIQNLYSFDGKIYTVNKSPVGINQGSVTVFDLFSNTFTNKVFGLKFDEGYGIANNQLYINLDFGIGSFDLVNQNISDTVIIADPGSLNKIFIKSAAIDYLNSYIYYNVGTFPPTNGICVVSTTAGDSITTFATGLNPDAVAIDYRAPSAITPHGSGAVSLILYPNPVRSQLNVSYSGSDKIQEVVITDFTGRTVYNDNPSQVNSLKIDTHKLPDGMYFLTVKTESGIVTRKFIKQ